MNCGFLQELVFLVGGDTKSTFDSLSLDNVERGLKSQGVHPLLVAALLEEANFLELTSHLGKVSTADLDIIDYNASNKQGVK